MRIFFTVIYFILMALIEQKMDFYQFRWLAVMSLNQVLVFFSVQIDPLHSLVLMGVVTYPFLSVLELADLRKVDPMLVI